MSDAPRPPSEGTVPPVPPHVAPAAPPHPAPSVPPYAQGYVQQPYPGAPPVWNAPPAAPTGSKALAGTALGVAIAGAVASLVPFGITVSWLFLVAAIVLAIVALVRRSRGRGMSVAALLVSGAGIVVAALWVFWLEFFGGWIGGLDTTDSYIYGDDAEYDDGYPILGVEHDVRGGSRDAALAYGTTVMIVDESTGEDVYELTVDAPEDVTGASTGAQPVNGAYLAIPIAVTNLTDETIDAYAQYEYTAYAWLLTGDGGRAEATSVPGATEQYPQIWDVTPIEPGESVTYYETFDVAASVTASGYLVLDLDSGQQVFWGP